MNVLRTNEHSCCKMNVKYHVKFGGTGNYSYFCLQNYNIFFKNTLTS